MRRHARPGGAHNARASGRPRLRGFSAPVMRLERNRKEPSLPIAGMTSSVSRMELRRSATGCSALRRRLMCCTSSGGPGPPPTRGVVSRDIAPGCRQRRAQLACAAQAKRGTGSCTEKGERALLRFDAGSPGRRHAATSHERASALAVRCETRSTGGQHAKRSHHIRERPHHFASPAPASVQKRLAGALPMSMRTRMACSSSSRSRAPRSASAASVP